MADESSSASACPDDDALATFASRGGPPETWAHLNEHVQSCSVCSELLDAMRATFDVEEPALGPESTFGRYELVAEIGKGGMGLVYEARDPVLGRRVALKVLRGSAGDAREEARLLREARAMARVAHPNVVAVYDAGIQDGRVFVAMELVRGTSLREHLRAHPELSFDERLQLHRAAARALVAAHAANVVHRDFKPENVLVDATGARVMDFGLARPAGGAVDDTVPTSADARWMVDGVTHGVHGTPSYMSPEQLDGRPTIDARSDQWSFAVALYESLFRMHPFELGGVRGAVTLRDLRAAMERGPAQPPALPASHAWLWPLLVRALRVVPDQRFADMAELVTALEGPPPEAPQATRLLGLLAAGLGMMACLHVVLVAAIIIEGVLGGDTPDEPLSRIDKVALTIVFVWGPLGAILAPMSVFGIWRRKASAMVSTGAYALLALPSGLGTPLALFAIYALSRRSVRAALTKPS